MIDISTEECSTPFGMKPTFSTLNEIKEAIQISQKKAPYEFKVVQIL